MNKSSKFLFQLIREFIFSQTKQILESISYYYYNDIRYFHQPILYNQDVSISHTNVKAEDPGPGIFRMLFFYSKIIVFFLIGVATFGVGSVYRELSILLVIQLVIYSVIFCCIATSLFLSFTKTQLLLINTHILLSIYYLLVFQLVRALPEEKFNYILALFFSALLLIAVVTVTPKRSFNERIWSMGTYLGVLYYFDLSGVKYFSVLFLFLLLINLIVTLKNFWIRKTFFFVKSFYPELLDITNNRKNLLVKYSAVSMFFWTICDLWIYKTFEVNFNRNFLTLSYLGFWLPNIIFGLQLLFNKPLLLTSLLTFYFIFNNFLFVARLHTNILVHDPKVYENFDSVIQEMLSLVKSGSLRQFLARQWKNVGDAVKAGGEPNRWGGPAATMLGIGAGSYFSYKSITYSDKANEIADKANEIAEKQLEATNTGNETAQGQLKATNKGNETAQRQLESTNKGNETAQRQLESTNKANEIAAEANQINKAMLQEQKKYNDFSIKDNSLEQE